MPEPAATTVQTTTTPAAANEWHAGLDADTKGWIGGMGLDKLPAEQALAKVIPMYRGAEQKLGVPAEQLLRLPGKDAKPEDMRAFYTKLGAPEKPEGYELPLPDGADPEFAKQASSWFHELGIPKAAAAGLTAKWNEWAASMQAKQDEQWNARFDKEVEALKGEWKGDDYAKNTDLAKRVMKAAGWAPEQLQAIERALGPAAFLKGFAKFGAMVGEHRFVGDGGSQQFAQSPEQAQARIKDLQKDAQWMAKYLSGDADKAAEWKRLHEVAFPEPQQAA